MLKNNYKKLLSNPFVLITALLAFIILIPVIPGLVVAWSLTSKGLVSNLKELAINSFVVVLLSGCLLVIGYSFMVLVGHSLDLLLNVFIDLDQIFGVDEAIGPSYYTQRIETFFQILSFSTPINIVSAILTGALLIRSKNK